MKIPGINAKKSALILGAALLIGAGALSFSKQSPRAADAIVGAKIWTVASNSATTTFTENCSECHMPYPPSFLPAAGWKSIMSNLADHFGENAELDTQTALEIENYLVSKAGDPNSRRFRRVKGVPIQITKLPWFVHEHDDIPRRLVVDNPEVLSFSQCDSCHRGAEKGYFDDDNVNIPGFGRWDD